MSGHSAQGFERSNGIHSCAVPICGFVAQMLEQWTCNPKFVGSSPTTAAEFVFSGQAVQCCNYHLFDLSVDGSKLMWYISDVVDVFCSKRSDKTAGVALGCVLSGPSERKEEAECYF